MFFFKEFFNVGLGGKMFIKRNFFFVLLKQTKFPLGRKRKKKYFKMILKFNKEM